MVRIACRSGVEDLRGAREGWIGPDVIDVVTLDVLVEKAYSAADHQLAPRMWLPGESHARFKVGPVVLHKPSGHLLATNPDAVQIRVGSVVEPAREVARRI